MEARKEDMMDNIYDKAFRMLVNKCPRFLIPMVNEIFGEEFEKGAEVILGQNEHFINEEKGKTKERITDTNFIIRGVKRRKSYHLECESGKRTKNMLLRIIEYDMQIGLERSVREGDVLNMPLPDTAVLYLRSDEDAKNSMTVRFSNSLGTFDNQIQIMKIRDYSIDEIFAKELYMLIPFYIFNLEGRFDELEEKPGIVSEIYTDIAKRMVNLVESDKMDVYEQKLLTEAMIYVISGIARRHEKVRKEMVSVMRGPLLRFDFEDAYEEAVAKGMSEGMAKGMSEGMAKGMSEGLAKGLDEGLAKGLDEGLAKGLAKGKEEALLGLVKEGVISAAVAAEKLGIPEAEVNKKIG